MCPGRFIFITLMIIELLLSTIPVKLLEGEVGSIFLVYFVDGIT